VEKEGKGCASFQLGLKSINLTVTCWVWFRFFIHRNVWKREEDEKQRSEDDSAGKTVKNDEWRRK